MQQQRGEWGVTGGDIRRPANAARISGGAGGVFLQGQEMGQTIPIGPGTRTCGPHRRRHKRGVSAEAAGRRHSASLSTHGPPLGRTPRDKEHKFALRGNGQLAIDTAHMGAHGTF